MAPDAPRPQQVYPITGIPVKDDPSQVGPYKKVGVRQNIDVWSSNPDNEKQVYLFVMALDRFQKIDPGQKESYFQIAGIHGQPSVPWDEPEFSAADKGTQEEGKSKSYCTHNTVLFPIWHRPYLSLYEQRLYEIMRDEIIPKFPADKQQAWRAAADSWRFPFWDWAISNRDSHRGTVKVPKLAKYPTTEVVATDAETKVRIDNPLYQFKMPNNKIMREYGVQPFVDPWEQKEELDYGACIGTSRQPDDEDAGVTAVKTLGIAVDKTEKVIRTLTDAWKHGVVNNAEVERAISQPYWGENVDFGKPAQAVYDLLTVNIEYSTFATTGTVASDKEKEDKKVTDNLNIEYIHNMVHGWVGGAFGGHMSQIPVASFDPLFWLHHCNIDRIFALWQGLNPDKWFTSGTVNPFVAQELVGLENGTTITPDKTPLRPFHKDVNGTYLTANDCRYTFDLGYTYPELQRWDTKYNPNNQFSQDLYKKNIVREINRLYGESRQLLLGADGSLKGVDPVDGGTKSVDFAFSIRYKKYALGGKPFWVNLYLAKESRDPNAAPKPNIATDTKLAEIYNFSQEPVVDGQVNCENCKKGQEDGGWATAYVSITPVLIQLIKDKDAGKDGLKTLTKEDVLKYLRDHAYWRIFRNGLEVPSYDVQKVDPQIIGSTNDATNWEDETKPPTLENFEEQPSISGGADGALNPALSQPKETSPPPVPQIPKTNLSVGKTIPFKTEVGADGVVIIESSKVDLDKIKTNDIDNTQFYFSDANGNIIFLMSIRRAEAEIVFNTCINNQWGKEQRVSLSNRFKDSKSSILVHDQGEGYEVFIDWVHVTWFQKRAPGVKAKTVSYTVNKGQKPVWSTDLTVKVYSSMKELFSH